MKSFKERRLRKLRDEISRGLTSSNYLTIKGNPDRLALSLTELKKLAAKEPDSLVKVFSGAAPFTLEDLTETIELFDPKMINNAFSQESTFQELRLKFNTSYLLALIKKAIPGFIEKRKWRISRQAIDRISITHLILDSHSGELLQYLRSKAKAPKLLDPHNGLVFIKRGFASGARDSLDSFDTRILEHYLEQTPLPSLYGFNVYHLRDFPLEIFATQEIFTLETEDFDSSYRLVRTVFEGLFDPADDLLEAEKALTSAIKSHQAL